MDIPIVLAIQAGAIIRIGQSYSFDYKEIDFIDCLKYCFGSSIVEVAQIGVEGASIIGKNILKEGAEQGVKQLVKTSSKATLKPLNYLIELLAKYVIKSGTREEIKAIPILGTIIGGILASSINTINTSTLCYKCQKYYEKKVLDDLGLNFLKNRIECFKNLYLKLVEFADIKFNWPGCTAKSPVPSMSIAPSRRAANPSRCI